MTDAELVRAARANDPVAWQALCRQYLPLVWRYAHVQLHDTHAAEDVTSETLLALLKNIDTIDVDAAKISAWLRSVVRHKVADHHRRSYRAQQTMPRLQYEPRRGSGPPPEEALERSETRNGVLEVLDKLPDRQRLALEWKYVEGLRVREIAQRLGETEKAVEAALYRARREFRRHYSSACAGSPVASAAVSIANGSSANGKSQGNSSPAASAPVGCSTGPTPRPPVASRPPKTSRPPTTSLPEPTSRPEPTPRPQPTSPSGAAQPRDTPRSP